MEGREAASHSDREAAAACRGLTQASGQGKYLRGRDAD